MPVELEFDYHAATASMDIFSQDDIDLLQQWTQKLDKSKYVPKDLTNKQILLFYNACYGDLDKTKTCIEKYYSFRKNAPEFFDGRVINSDELKPNVEALFVIVAKGFICPARQRKKKLSLLWKLLQCREDGLLTQKTGIITLEFSYLPEKSCEGYDIIYHRLHYTEPSKYNLEPGVKLLFMTVDACLNKRGPQPGYIFLFDMRGVKLGHLTRVSLSSLRKFFQYVQEALPVRMKAIHVLNTEPVLDKLLLLIRPFMDKKFYDMLKFHHKNESLEKFYETVVPRSALPPDYGGTLPDTQTLHKRCMQQLEALEPYFKSEEEQRIAALPNKKRDKAMEKAFKNLDID